nr:hypothetical protein [Mesorhizobium ciceri]
MLSFPDVPSRVGAVTVGGKSGSKTGLSHIFDWAVLLDFVSRSADLTPEGRLVAKIRARSGATNPYLIGLERVVYAWSFVRADFDVFKGLVLALAEVGKPIKKKDAAFIYAEIISGLAEESEKSRSMSSSQKQPLFDALADIERAARHGELPGSTSTAWHRTSSRMETLVDLGLLEKGSQSRSYEYFYMPTARLSDAARTIGSQTTYNAWVNENLIALFGPKNLISGTPELTIELLNDAMTLITSGTPLVSIDHLSLSLAILAAEGGTKLNLNEVRTSVLAFARQHPDVVRPSAGRYSRDAEFVSVRRRGALR